METNVSSISDIYIPIKNLKVGKTYDQVFFLFSSIHSSSMKTLKGNLFAKITLKDISGQITGTLWDYKDSIHFNRECFVRLKIKVEKDGFSAQSYTLSILETVPENLYDYIHGIGESRLDVYCHEIEEILNQIDDADYRNILGNAIFKLDLIHALRNSPYGSSGPLAYKGGLLIHIVHSLRISLKSIEQAQELEMPLNKSLIIIGSILRNIGWHTTTVFQENMLRLRDAFKLIGISRASSRYIDHLILTVEADLQTTIPESKKQALENLCFANKDNILTVEGKIVAAADEMVSTLHFGNFMLQGKQEGNWTNGMFINK